MFESLNILNQSRGEAADQCTQSLCEADLRSDKIQICVKLLWRRWAQVGRASGHPGWHADVGGRSPEGNLSHTRRLSVFPLSEILFAMHFLSSEYYTWLNTETNSGNDLFAAYGFMPTHKHARRHTLTVKCELHFPNNGRFCRGWMGACSKYRTQWVLVNKAGFGWKWVKQERQGAERCACVRVCARARARASLGDFHVCVAVYASAFASVVHARVPKWVSECVCVSKIINHPQKRVIPLLCVRANREGPEEERKCWFSLTLVHGCAFPFD